MNGKLTYGISLILGILALVLLITNVALVNSNRLLQDSVSQRQAEINKGTSLAQLNQSLVQALADAVIRTNDSDARALLAAQGITVKANSEKSAAPAAAPAAKK